MMAGMAIVRTVDPAKASPAGRWVTRVALVMLALSLTGCSFLFSKPPPKDYRKADHFDCSGYALPILDTLWVAANGITAARAMGTSDVTWKQQNHDYDRMDVIAVGTVWVIVSGISAIYGYKNAAQCARATDEMPSKRKPPPAPPGLPTAPTPVFRTPAAPPTAAPAFRTTD
jgi:hypothetical protein